MLHWAQALDGNGFASACEVSAPNYQTNEENCSDMRKIQTYHLLASRCLSCEIVNVSTGVREAVVARKHTNNHMQILFEMHATLRLSANHRGAAAGFPAALNLICVSVAEIMKVDREARKLCQR